MLSFYFQPVKIFVIYNITIFQKKTKYNQITMGDTSMDSVGDVDFQPSLDMSCMPTVVKNRVKALKKLQFETVKAEELYYKEIHQLDLKYQKMYEEINGKRLQIVR